VVALHLLGNCIGAVAGAWLLTVRYRLVREVSGSTCLEVTCSPFVRSSSSSRPRCLLALGGARLAPAQAVSADLFLSEYIEGTSNNRAPRLGRARAKPAPGFIGSLKLVRVSAKELAI
jgi:hypothetical protein